MPGLTTRALAGATKRVPGLRRIPMLKLLAVAEIGLLAHEHVTKLDRGERRRLVELVRVGRGRRRNLSARERDELNALVAKIEPRMFVGAAADKLSPVKIPAAVRRAYEKRA